MEKIMRRPILRVATTLVSVALCATFTGAAQRTDQEVSRGFQEALLQQFVESGMLQDGQRQAILRNWDVLRARAKESGLTLRNWTYRLAEGDRMDFASVDFYKELTNMKAPSGTLSLDSTGRVMEITIRFGPVSDLTPGDMSELVDVLSKGCLIDPRDKPALVAKLKAATGVSVSFTSKDACSSKQQHP
jgi:hypothetical protein